MSQRIARWSMSPVTPCTTTIQSEVFNWSAAASGSKEKAQIPLLRLGPFLATRDEVPDAGHLALWLKVNEEYRQNGNTSNMIFDVPTIVSYVSEFMTLLPGDVISTGTPAGVGLGMKPPQYLKAGDVVDLGIAGLGESRQKVVAWQK